MQILPPLLTPVSWGAVIFCEYNCKIKPEYDQQRVILTAFEEDLNWGWKNTYCSVDEITVCQTNI